MNSRTYLPSALSSWYNYVFWGFEPVEGSKSTPILGRVGESPHACKFFSRAGEWGRGVGFVRYLDTKIIQDFWG